MTYIFGMISKKSVLFFALSYYQSGKSFVLPKDLSEYKEDCSLRIVFTMSTVLLENYSFIELWYKTEGIVNWE